MQDPASRNLYAGLRFQAWSDALQYPAAADKHSKASNGVPCISSSCGVAFSQVLRAFTVLGERHEMPRRAGPFPVGVLSAFFLFGGFLARRQIGARISIAYFELEKHWECGGFSYLSAASLAWSCFRGQKWRQAWSTRNRHH